MEENNIQKEIDIIDINTNNNKIVAHDKLKNIPEEHIPKTYFKEYINESLHPKLKKLNSDLYEAIKSIEKCIHNMNSEFEILNKNLENFKPENIILPKLCLLLESSHTTFTLINNEADRLKVSEYKKFSLNLNDNNININFSLKQLEVLFSLITKQFLEITKFIVKFENDEYDITLMINITRVIKAEFQLRKTLLQLQDLNHLCQEHKLQWNIKMIYQCSRYLTDIKISMKSQEKVDKMQKMLGKLNEDENNNDYLIKDEKVNKRDSILDYYVNLKSVNEIDDININEKYTTRTLEEIYTNENQNADQKYVNFDDDENLNNEIFKKDFNNLDNNKNVTKNTDQFKNMFKELV